MTPTTSYMDVDDYWWNGTVNETDVGPTSHIAAMKLAHKIVLTSILLFIMLAMGCTITLKDIKDVLRVPTSVLIGMLCQFILLPLTGFCLALALSLPAHYAIGVLVISCCPGGTVSNLFTFWTNGDVCLSICMTTVSTVVAIGMMPFNLFIYSRVWTNDRAIIPFVSIFTSLVCILIPVAIGMLIRWKRKEWTSLIARVGSILGLLGILTSIILTALINPSTYRVGWRVWICLVLLPSLGATVGYALALLLRRSTVQSRTIAFETGLQNVSLAITLILLTFKDTPHLYTLLIYPSLYGPCMMFEGFAAVFVYKLVNRCSERKWTQAPKVDDVDDFGYEANMKSI
ncbi:ileal sodium/bile acid cotransporter-like [Diadema antillarum]|uniref:ileal sodium/bile acid cotransporter-like n=1 Tax=Diadema antillarum TaxID=105358 RepID=UPI003A8696E1